jgi:hypothetical protein
MSAPELVFALARGQNAFFAELAEALVFELDRLGAPARIVVGEFPEHRTGVVTVLLPPHEFVALSGVRPSLHLMRRCLLISAEQPSSGFFAENLDLAREAGAVLDINHRAVRAYREAGVAAEHLQLGYSAAWDRRDAVAARDIDILFVGRTTPRRERALASYAAVLERFDCHFVLSDDRSPNTGDGVNFAARDHKLGLLARSKVLLNIHGEDEPYFEWLRVSEAMSSGCLVVSEHSSDVDPLRPGADLLAGDLASLGLLAAWMIDDEGRRAEMVRSADERMRSSASLAEGATSLLAAARSVDRAAAGPAEAFRAQLMTAQMALPYELPRQPPEPDGVSIGQHRALRAIKRQHQELLALRRRLDADELARRRPERPEAETVEVAATRAWHEASRPQVSVIVPLYNDEEVIGEALDSVLGSTTSSWEIVVVDDCSGDGGPAVVREWMDHHEDRRCSLVHHEVNRGLSSARNTGAERARGELLMMLDSDNLLRRFGLAKLVEALRQDHSAAFAYGILDRFTTHEPIDLVSKFDWEPERLREGNYIDAMALIRRRVLLGIGGYSRDPRLGLGLEDYDLWARFAEEGHRGAFVRQFVGSYRMGHSSMLSVTNVSVTDALSAIAEHAPTLMRGVEISA